MTSCANQVALTGGPRDEEPPVLDTSTSFKNFQTKFVKTDIELNFDEFVTLRNPVKQVVISPPLQYLPKIEGKGKKVSLKFSEEEELKKNATYVINFGESIVDFNEGNIAENFILVYSTGDYIDSLSISGQVKSAFDDEGVEDVLVMLYESFEDSVIYKERPFYFSRTGEEGRFKINNLRADTFKVMVLEDLNLNYLYDPISERIGFLDSLIMLTDTIDVSIDLEIFKESSPPKFVSYEVFERGRMELEFDQNPELSNIMVLDSLDYYLENSQREGIINLWYKPVDRSNVRLTYKTLKDVDTIQTRINLRNIQAENISLEITKVNDNGKVGLYPTDDLVLSFNRPVIALNDSVLTMIDTINRDTLEFSVDSLNFPTQEIALKAKWTAGGLVQLNALPGSFVDFFGVVNDTIQKHVVLAAEEDFGSIQISTSRLKKENTYLIQLMQKDEIIQHKSFSGDQDIVKFEHLPPGSYSLRVIIDANANGKWDPGNYLTKIQSENIFTVELETLRENWTLETELVEGQSTIPNYDSQDR